MTSWDLLGPPRTKIEPNPTQIKPNPTKIQSKSTQNPGRILIEILGNPNTRIGKSQEIIVKTEKIYDKSQAFLRSSQDFLRSSTGPPPCWRDIRGERRQGFPRGRLVATLPGNPGAAAGLIAWPRGSSQELRKSQAELLGNYEGSPRSTQDSRISQDSLIFLLLSQDLGFVLGLLGFYQVLIWI